VSNVKNMSEMFRGAVSFDCDISDWNVSNVETMYCMFRNSCFNKDISKWNLESLKNWYMMYAASPMVRNKHKQAKKEN
jgi:hypothetical protein